MENNQTEFLLKEYDKLSSEVAKLLEETRTREKYSLAIISLVAAWIYTEIIKNPVPNNVKRDSLILIIHTLSWIPLIITGMYGISVLLIYKNIKWIGSYLKIIEEFILNELKDGRGNLLGWENYFDKKNRKSYFVLWTWIFWIIQIIIASILICKSNSIYKL